MYTLGTNFVYELLLSTETDILISSFQLTTLSAFDRQTYGLNSTLFKQEVGGKKNSYLSDFLSNHQAPLCQMHPLSVYFRMEKRKAARG